jgi:Pentapeptide repeats (9 copies)
VVSGSTPAELPSARNSSQRFSPTCGRARQNAWLPPVHFHGTQFSGYVNFRGAQFSGDAFFGDAQFSDNAIFGDAQFSGDASFYGAQFGGDASFGDTQFSGKATFQEAQISGDAFFRKARFGGDATFAEAQFSGKAGFGRAQFSGDASFYQAQFSSDATFLRAQFSRDPGFIKTRFSGPVDFIDARFAADASFGSARFSGDTRFGDAQFSGKANFGWAHFSDYASFGGARFSGDARFHAARFAGTAYLGPMVVVGTLDCDDAVFDDDVRIQTSACALTCRRTQFDGRGELSVRWAEVALDDATFVGRSHLVGVGPLPRLDDTAVRDARADASYADRAGRPDQRLDAQARPRLLSMRQANVENLALWNVDLRACRFFGALGLDELRIEADCEFAAPPGSWRTRRRTLAEEHDWRADPGDAAPTRGPSPWLPPECQPAAWLERDNTTEILDPRRIASLYRALRKAFEDRKDEPGAGDFYYGEMEMRRQRPPPTPATEWRFTRDRGERVILTLYWLVSGYGMRASRALGFLAMTVAIGALLLAHGGFVGRGPAGGSLAFALESTISLLRAPTARLTAYGEYVQIALRLLGPLFVGLALLALRGRVKR